MRGPGNMNAPPDIGEFLNDLPRKNHFQWVDQNGVPLAGAQIEVYQSTAGGPNPRKEVYNDELFDNTPDLSFVADERGSIELPRNPFSGNAVNSRMNTVFLWKVRFRGQLYFAFQEVTDFNLAFARGQVEDAYYIREIDLRDNPHRVPQNAWLGTFFDGTNFEHPTTTVLSENILFDWGQAQPTPDTPAENWSAYFQGDIKFVKELRTFNITSDGGLRLWIDGRLALDEWENNALKTWTPSIYTTQDAPFINAGSGRPNPGLHRVEVRYRHRKGPAVLQIR